MPETEKVVRGLLVWYDALDQQYAQSMQALSDMENPHAWGTVAHMRWETDRAENLGRAGAFLEAMESLTRLLPADLALLVKVLRSDPQR